MSEGVEFEVVGLPAPQGSKRPVGIHGGRHIMVEDNKNTKPWRSLVAAAARDVADEVGQFDCPLYLAVEFRFPMPKSRPKRVREAGIGPKTTAPDLDKLVRAVGDALKQGGLIRDDALIWKDGSYKVEVTGWTGAVISLRPLAEVAF